MLEKIKFITIAVGTISNYLFGGFDDVLIFLLIVMTIDYCTGVIKGYILKSLSSETGFRGILKKVLMLFIIIICVQMDRLMGLKEPLFRVMICWYFIANECISIFENCGEMGIPIHPKLKEALEQIKEKGSF